MLEQDPYWIHLIEEYRTYRYAFSLWKRGMEAIGKLPKREGEAVVDILVALRRSQGLPMDEALLVEEIEATPPEPQFMESDDDDEDYY